MITYSIIINSVIIGGIGVSVWGWKILRTTQKIKQWPCVDGVIVKSEPTSELDELLPHIDYRYTVNGKSVTHNFKFPSGTNPMPEFAQAYVKKYPLNEKVTVFYNPQQPEQSTLEPGAQGDWMVLALGLLMLMAGVIALLI